MTTGVLLSQPVHQHGYQTAQALYERQVLDTFVTGLYLDPELVARLPRRLRLFASRRSHADLPSVAVTRMPLQGIAHLAARALPAGRESAVDAVFDSFDRAASRLVRPWHRAVHVFEGTGIRTARAAAALGVPVVLDVPSVFEGSRRQQQSDPGSRAAQRRNEQERRLADVLLAPSDRVRDALTEAGVPAERIALLPYGVDVGRFSRRDGAARARDCLRLLWVGNDSRHKGLDLLVAAVEQLTRRGHVVQLRIVGAQDTLGRSLKRCHPHHDWVGSVPKSEVHEHFLASDAFVLPTAGEGSSLATLEALAAGLAVVTTNFSGLPLLHGSTALIIRERSVDALAEQVGLLLADDALLARLQAAGPRLVASEYTWERYRDRIGALYTSRPELR